MQNQTNFQTLVPAIVSLVVFAATIGGKQIDQMTVEQGVTAGVTLIGVIYGIFTNHKAPTSQPPQVQLPLMQQAQPMSGPQAPDVPKQA